MLTNEDVTNDTDVSAAVKRLHRTYHFGFYTISKYRTYLWRINILGCIVFSYKSKHVLGSAGCMCGPVLTI
jgi:hypothetical protein